MNQHIICMGENKNLEGMAEAIFESLVEKEKMESQILKTEQGGCVVQGREGNKWKKFIGMDKAITVKISPVSSTSVMLEIGEGKWADKAVVGTISMFVLWPLALTTLYGSVKQTQLPGKILQTAEHYAAA